jgi:hypothetical protein
VCLFGVRSLAIGDAWYVAVPADVFDAR